MGKNKFKNDIIAMLTFFNYALVFYLFSDVGGIYLWSRSSLWLIVGSLITAICIIFVYVCLNMSVYTFYALSSAQVDARGRGRFPLVRPVP